MHTLNPLRAFGLLPLVVGIVWSIGMARADDPAPVDADADSVTQAEIASDLAELKSDVAVIKESLKRLERQLQLDNRPLEIVPVKISIRDEDGRPVAGAKVSVEGRGDLKERATRATGTTNENGVGIDRPLPYGEYRVDVETPFGWTDGHTETIEFGKAFERTIIVPTDDEPTTVTIRADFSKEPLRGLRFGEHTERSGSGYATAFSPEPGEKSSTFESFPTVGDGIERVGLSMKAHLQRTVRQPDGTDRKFRYEFKQPGREPSSYLYAIVAPGSVAVGRLDQEFGETRNEISDEERERLLTSDTAERYFVPETYDDYRPRYGLLPRPTQTPPSEWTFECPPGELTLYAFSLVGLGSHDVAKALDVDPDKYDVWLEANVNNLSGPSEWTKRTFDLEGWDQDKSLWVGKRQWAVEEDKPLTVTISGREGW